MAGIRIISEGSVHGKVVVNIGHQCISVEAVHRPLCWSVGEPRECCGIVEILAAGRAEWAQPEVIASCRVAPQATWCSRPRPWARREGCVVLRRVNLKSRVACTSQRKSRTHYQPKFEFVPVDSSQASPFRAAAQLGSQPRSRPRAPGSPPRITGPSTAPSYTADTLTT